MIARYSLPVIEIGYDPRSIDSYLKILEQKGIDYSFRFAMNRALAVANEVAEKQMKDKRGVGKSTMPSVDEYLEPEKVRLKDIRNLKNARLRALSQGKTSLTHHILGRHNPQQVGGLAMRLRRKLYTRLARTGAHPKSFLARAKLRRMNDPDARGKPQVFTRGDFKGRSRLFRQTVADAEQLTTRDDIQEEMERRATVTGRESFYRMIEKRLNELNREPLTMKEQSRK